MRLALGYKMGLPNGWPYNEKKRIPHVVECFGKYAFPDRRVQAWHSPPWPPDLSDNVEYMGDTYTGPPKNGWLTAFAYNNRDGTRSHMVIGEPACDVERLVLVIQVQT